MRKERKELEKLEKELKAYEKEIVELLNSFREFQNDSLQTIQQKEQTIQGLNTKLANIQQRKAEIQNSLDDKVKEIKNSQLSNEEKAKQIVELLGTDKKELDLITERLEKARISCSSQQAKLMNYLLKPCSTCECKVKTIKDLKCMRNWLIGSNSLLLLIIFAFVYYFFYK